MGQQQELAQVRKTLQCALGVTAVAAGADKYFNWLTDWEKYLNPLAAEVSGLTPKQFMRIVGAVEIAAGIGLLTGLKRSGGYMISAWLLGITANLVTQGKYLDIGVRDVNMALEAWALARISAIEGKLEGNAGLR